MADLVERVLDYAMHIFLLEDFRCGILFEKL